MSGMSLVTQMREVLRRVLPSPWSIHTPPSAQEVSKPISFHCGFFEIKMITNGYTFKTCYFSVRKLTFHLKIEPNKHQPLRFQRKYNYHTDHSKNPKETQFSQFSLYVTVLLSCKILYFGESQSFSGKLERIVGLSREPPEHP